MIIAQISDTHIDMDANDNQRRIENFRDTMADINNLPRPPDIVIHTGDVAHNGKPDEYRIAREILNETPLPSFVIPGNRDDRSILAEAFAHGGYANRHPDFLQYEIGSFPIGLILLDTVSSSSNRGEYCDKRSDHLTDLINNNSNKPVLIFSHHPPFEAKACPDPFQFTDRQSANNLIADLQKIDHFQAFFCGHVHRFDIGTVCGAPAFAMPSITTSLRWGDYPSHLVETPIYQIIEVHDNQTVSVETRVVQAI